MTFVAKKRGALCLDNAIDRLSFTARAQLVGQVIDPVVILVAAGLVECVAISAIRKSRSLIVDRFV